MNKKFLINDSLLLDLTANELQFQNNGHQERLQLENMLIQILTQLSEQANEVVPRDQFIEKLWANNSNVGNPALTKAVSKLRKVLKDQFQQEGLIETVPKKGYRLKAHVKPLLIEKQEKTSLKKKSSTTQVLLIALVILFVLKLLVPGLFHWALHGGTH